MHPALRKGPLFLQKITPPISFPAYGPDVPPYLRKSRDGDHSHSSSAGWDLLSSTCAPNPKSLLHAKEMKRDTTSRN